MGPICRTLSVLVAVLALAAPAAAHSGHPHAGPFPALGIPTPAPASAYAGLTKNPQGRCGDAYEVRTQDTKGNTKIGCTHGPDPAPPGARPANQTPSIAELRADAAALPATSPIACDGEHSTGMRVTAIYAYTTNQVDRYDRVAPLIREYAAFTEDIFYESARETGGSRSIRWLTEPSAAGGCRLKVLKVALSPSGGDSFANTMTELRNDHGLTGLDRRFVVWLDGFNGAGICGVADMAVDDSPGQDNQNNGGQPPGYYGNIARIDSRCWGFEHEPLEAHELAHTLGAVQMTAPNSTGGLHCTDEWDAMCYSDAPDYPAMAHLCGTANGDSSHNARLDCNHDDYFHTSPPAGSYLATHWNVARNSFLQEGRILGDGTTVTKTSDGDTVPEPGETVSFTTRVKNRASTAATAVSGTVTSANAASAPLPGAKAYPDIAGGGTGTNAIPHGLTIKSTTPCGVTVPATVRITASSGTHDVAVAIPTGTLGATTTSTATPAVAIPDNDPAGVTSTVTLPSGGRIADVDVRLNITHGWAPDLDAFLIHPDGTTVELLTDAANGADLTSTVLDDEADALIEDGEAPFTGSFRPEGSLAALDGKLVGGAWKLKVIDDYAGNTGTLDSWALTRSSRACPPPPAAAPDPAGWSAAPATAKGDIDGDGLSDLVTGAPGENDGRGAVHVLYGTADGLAATDSQQWTQDSAGVAGTAEAGDRFGASVAVGDLNGDGRADVAIGAPGEDGSVAETGAVHVLYGTAGGLSATGSQIWTQGSGGLGGAAEAYDRFGAALAIGDLGRTTHADLTVGTPDEDQGAATDAGTAQVIYGTAGGLTATGTQHLSQGSGGVAETPESGDRFGATLALGSLGRGGQRDLAVGAPWEDLAGAADAGVVHVLFGASTGVTATGAQLWSQNSTGVEDEAEAGDHFGASLATGDLGKTTTAELAIGVPDENLAAADAGLVHVLYTSSDTGPVATGSQLWSQDTAGIDDTAEASDRFGASLAIGNFGRTTHRDLAIGVPAENLAAPDAGLVHAVYGTAAGLAAAGSQIWSQDTAGIADAAESWDRFGSGLAVGQYGRSAQEDLIVAVPSEDAGAVDSGLVHAVYGTADGLAAPDSQLWSQASAGVVDTAEAGDGFGGGAGR